MLPIDFQGIDIIRGRDCVVFSKGDGYAMTVSSTMLLGGWVGGQGAQWDTYTNPDVPVLTYSSGLFGGFMLWGSNETADQFTSMTAQYLRYGFGVLMAGRAILSTIAFEQFTYASRTGGGSPIALTYSQNDLLFMSSRGYWTKEDELSIRGIGLAPALPCGVVVQIPSPVNRFYLGIQTKL